MPDQKHRSVRTPLSDFRSVDTKLNYVFITGSEIDKMKAILSRVIPLSLAVYNYGSFIADKLGSLQQDQVQAFPARCFPLSSTGTSSDRYGKAVGKMLDTLGT